MSRRPENWKNPHPDDIPIDLKYCDCCLHDAFEAGAEEMLKALKADGTYTKSSHIDSDMEGGEGQILTSGWLVFIPEEA